VRPEAPRAGVEARDRERQGRRVAQEELLDLERIRRAEGLPSAPGELDDAVAGRPPRRPQGREVVRAQLAESREVLATRGLTDVQQLDLRRIEMLRREDLQ
jgi:hypothetical protein